MKELLHKILSTTIAVLVLFSTLSYTIDMHYCGDILVETAIFHKAKGCGMEMQNSSSEDCSIIKKNCCSDKQMVIDGQDELQLSFNNHSFEQQQFVASFIYTYINLFDDVEEDINSYRDYGPPLIVKQIYKLDETFLI